MIRSQEGLAVSLQQLAKLRVWENQTINDQSLHPRLKKSELAGIRGMIAQIEREIRVYNLSRLQNSIDELEAQVQRLDIEQLPTLLSQKIRHMREVADAMQPVI